MRRRVWLASLFSRIPFNFPYSWYMGKTMSEFERETGWKPCCEDSDCCG